MDTVFHWVGAGVVIGIALLISLFLVVGIYTGLKIIWVRTYFFQWYEFRQIKKTYLKKHYNYFGIKIALQTIKAAPRFKTHIFLPQIYEIIFTIKNELAEKDLLQPHH